MEIFNKYLQVSQIPPSSEQHIETIFDAEFFSSCFQEYKNSSGVIWSEKPSATANCLIVAEIPSFYYTVSEILKDGFIKVSPLSDKCDPHSLGKPCVIYGKQKIMAVSDYVKSMNYDYGPERILFTGLTTEELKQIVRPGDSAVFDVPPQILGDDKIVGGNIPHRVALLVILHLVQNLRLYKPLYNCYITFTSDLNYSNVKTAAASLNAEMAIIIAPKDDSFSIDKIGIATNFAVQGKLTDTLINKANNSSIPYTIIPYNYETQTCAESISFIADGIDTALLCLPVSRLCSMAQAVCIRPVLAVVSLISKFLCEGQD